VKVLHIVASPRGNESNTLTVSREFIAGLAAASDDLTVETIDLYHDDLPAVAGDNIESKYQIMVGRKIDPAHEESWKHIEALIDHFLEADLILITAPMWNLSIPYALKYYIDCLVQPGYTFAYNENGAYPLVTGRKMVVITSRGGDYSPGSPTHGYDFQEPYLRAIFGFIGFTDIEFINAQPMDINTVLREAALTDAIEKARALVAKIEVPVVVGV
jgi:FMN-dependent NADH-azoreductase